MQVRVALAVGLVAAFAVVAAGLAFALGDRAGEALGERRFEGALRPAGIPPVQFALRNQDGELVRASDLRGSPVVVTFLYTNCEDSCPLAAQQLRGALDRLGHDVPVVAITVDPRGDTPASARRFLLDQRMTGRMDFLLGAPADVQPIYEDFGVRPQSIVDAEQDDHTLSVVLLDERGRQRVGYPFSALTPRAVAHDLALLERGDALADPARTAPRR